MRRTVLSPLSHTGPASWAVALPQAAVTEGGI